MSFIDRVGTMLSLVLPGPKLPGSLSTRAQHLMQSGKMLAYPLRRYGPPSDLTLQVIARPTPSTGETLVRIHATAINDWDWQMVRGSPAYIRLICGVRRPKFTIPGVDYAGVIEAVGPDVQGFSAGDRVYGDLSDAGFGAFAQYACIGHAALNRMPEDMGFAVAAALPHAGTLALQALQRAPIRAGDRVLVNGAGGGVGVLAVQMARHLGAASIDGVDHIDKHPMMSGLGYDRCIDYRDEDFTRSGARYDLILDTKSTRPARAHARALNPGGRYITVGGKVASMLSTLARGLVVNRRGSSAHRVLALKPNGGMDQVAALATESILKPTIDGPHPFEELPNQLARFGAGEHLGKIVLTIP